MRLVYPEALKGGFIWNESLVCVYVFLEQGPDHTHVLTQQEEDEEEEKENGLFYVYLIYTFCV